MVNKVFLIGRLGKDPVIKHFSNDNAIAEFSLATNESYRNKEGQIVDVTDWHNIKIPTKRQAEIAEKYLKKGSQVFIEGKIRTRSYDDKDGNKRYVTEIIVDQFRMLDGKREGGGQDSGGSYQPSVSQTQHTDTGASGVDDDLPF
ncbi:MAG TPA: single-stranded DNA-binding protein [Chitinophagales bacterium]|nr:single-stranded DNA-binding protein [Chitinophagales bacterium]